MKNIIKLSLILTIVFGFTSCDSKDDDTSFLNDRQSASYFVPGSSANLLVEEFTTPTFDIFVGVSESKPFARSFTYSVDPSSTAVQGVDYTLSSTLSVPANSIVGSIVVTPGGYETTSLSGKTVKVVLNDVEGTILGNRDEFTLTIFRSCPVAEDYLVGTFMMQQISGSAPFGIGEAFGGDQMVEVFAKPNNVRSFNYLYAPGAFDSNYFMDLELICGNIFVSGTIQDGFGTLGCGNGSIGQATGDVTGSYDPLDDSEVTVNISDFEPDSGCTGELYQAVIKLIRQ